MARGRRPKTAVQGLGAWLPAYPSQYQPATVTTNTAMLEHGPDHGDNIERVYECAKGHLTIAGAEDDDLVNRGDPSQFSCRRCWQEWMRDTFPVKPTPDMATAAAYRMGGFDAAQKVATERHKSAQQDLRPDLEKRARALVKKSTGGEDPALVKAALEVLLKGKK